MTLITKFGLVFLLSGVAMLITGSLPKNKMEKVIAFLGAKADKHPLPLRGQLLFGGVIFLFFGLLLLQVITMPSLGGRVEVPVKKSERPPPPYRPPSTPRPTPR
jgi:hypothetical protein